MQINNNIKMQYNHLVKLSILKKYQNIIINVLNVIYF
jgi:hypothetical protein